VADVKVTSHDPKAAKATYGAFLVWIMTANAESRYQHADKFAARMFWWAVPAGRGVRGDVLDGAVPDRDGVREQGRGEAG
jgi:hypothetical protein